MRIAFTVTNGEISSMRNSEEADIYDGGRLVESLPLEEKEEHPGIYKFRQILSKSVDAIVTKRVGLPGFRLVESHKVKLFFTEGSIEKTIRGIEDGSLSPAGPDDVEEVHHEHHA